MKVGLTWKYQYAGCIHFCHQHPSSSAGWASSQFYVSLLPASVSSAIDPNSAGKQQQIKAIGVARRQHERNRLVDKSCFSAAPNSLQVPLSPSLSYTNFLSLCEPLKKKDSRIHVLSMTLAYLTLAATMNAEQAELFSGVTLYRAWHECGDVTMSSLNLPSVLQYLFFPHAGIPSLPTVTGNRQMSEMNSKEARGWFICWQQACHWPRTV